MKTNKRTELVLCMAALTGVAREITSKFVQTKLFAFGYKWADGSTQPIHLRKSALHVCTPEWKATDITYNEGPSYSSGPAIVFNAATDLQEFLSRAESALKESRIINGVVVTITPSKIDLNVTELVAKTTSEAQKIQSELFGSGLGSSPA